MTFLVVPECVWIEKWFATRGTHQPHPQCTLCRLWHVRLMAPLYSHQPSICILFWCPQLKAKRLHLGGEIFLWGWRDSFQYLFLIFCCRIGGFGYSNCKLLKGWMENGGRWRVVSLLRRRWGWGYGGMQYGSPQKPIKTFCLQSCHHCFNLPQPCSF